MSTRKRSLFDFLDAPVGKVASQTDSVSEFKRKAYAKPQKKPAFVEKK